MPPPDTVEPHLERILASSEFAAASQLRRFLQFTVQATLRGQHADLKEYLLGREVFGRGEDYDPRLDPIVRVEARRLRAKLQEYYEGSGRADALRIELPKGGYAASFRAVAASAPPPYRPGRRLAILGVAAAAIALLAIAAYRFLPAGAGKQSGDLVAVIPARWLWQSDAATEYLPADEEAAEAITAELANRRIGRVVAWPVVAGAAPKWGGRLVEAGQSLGARRLLIVAVRSRADGSRELTAYLLDAASGMKHSVVQTPVGESMRASAGSVAERLRGAILAR